ncbi:MAG: hypothetical protein ACHBN1_30890 [Heteroscytonema crispum UTEX LB 1556]
MAPLPRARSEPGGIFPTADASAPSPTTNDPSGEPVLGGKPSRSTRFTTNH